MTRTHRTETYNQAGELVETVETPWTRNDYIRAIGVLEGEITPRRMREAVLGVDGAVAPCDELCNGECGLEGQLCIETGGYGCGDGPAQSVLPGERGGQYYY
jgi:hypothetical protein